MVDIQKQITFWKVGAEEDLAVARQLVESGKTRHGLFFAHLALEKMLKALFCKHTGELAPKIHNLVRLAELAEALPSAEQLDTLAEMNAHNIESRYPETLAPPPTPAEAQRYMKQAEEVFQWLKSIL